MWTTQTNQYEQIGLFNGTAGPCGRNELYWVSLQFLSVVSKFIFSL